MDELERIDEAIFITTKADKLGGRETSGEATVNRVRASEPDGPISAAGGKSERGRRTGDKRNGAKIRNDLERQPSRQLDLVTAKAGQPALKATARILSLST